LIDFSFKVVVDIVANSTYRDPFPQKTISVGVILLFIGKLCFDTGQSIDGQDN
jgi:hypothetical protein